MINASQTKQSFSAFDESKMDCFLITDCNPPFLLHFLKHEAGEETAAHRTHPDTSTPTGATKNQTGADTSKLRHKPTDCTLSSPQTHLDRNRPQQANLIVPQEREFPKETKPLIGDQGEGSVGALNPANQGPQPAPGNRHPVNISQLPGG